MVEVIENSVNNNTIENETEITVIEQQEEERKEEESANKDSSTRTNDILHSVSVSIDNEHLPSKRIIQVIGGEHFKKKDRQENNNDSSSAENSNISISDDYKNNNDSSTIYELDAMTEDPFTLESFDTLIQQHAEKDKDFILARVTTV